MTVRDLIYSSLRLIGVYSQGETPSASDTNDAFSALNLMLDSWSTQNLMIPSITRTAFSCVAGVQTYSIGVGGTFNAPRPNRIQDALVIVQGSNPQLELPMSQITLDEFSSIYVKSVQSTIPLWYYFDNAFPLANISLWPVPKVNLQIALYMQLGLTQFATVDDLVVLAPGGARMLKYNLAIEVAPEYGKDNLDPKIVAIAEGSMNAYKRLINQNKKYKMTTDKALQGPRGQFNWLIGDTV